MSKLNVTEFFNKEASALKEAREECIKIHGSDIRAAGNEVEIAVREWLERMLPKTVSVLHGHLIDQNSIISPQIDCIISDKTLLPSLFTTKDGTTYIPIDSVYAIGEIKSTYYKNQDYINKFSDTLSFISSNMEHHLVENTAFEGVKPDSLIQHLMHGSSNKYLNNIFSFILFVDSGNGSTDEVRSIYLEKEDNSLPNVCVFLSREMGSSLCLTLDGKLEE